MREMTLPSPRPRKGHPNRRSVPAGAAQPAERLQDIVWGGKPSTPTPAEGTPRTPLPAHPLRRGAGLVQTDSPVLQSSRPFPRPVPKQPITTSQCSARLLAAVQSDGAARVLSSRGRAGVTCRRYSRSAAAPLSLRAPRAPPALSA